MKKKTDMEKVKTVARILLYSNVYKTEYSPMIVQHPFTSTGIIGIPALKGLQFWDLTKEEDLSAWHKMMEKEIERAETLFEIYYKINKPYGLTFLKFAMPYLSQRDFSIMLSDAWMRSENPNMDKNFRGEQLLSMFKQADPQELMNSSEQDVLGKMEDEITIYRGVTSFNAKRIRALSWTTEYETADWFAHRFEEEGTVYEAQIRKEHIYAYFDGRNESEVIVDPKYLTDIQIAQKPVQAIKFI